jgi:cytochrome P450
MAEPAARRFSFDPSDPELLRDPYAIYRNLRANDPVHWSDLGFWVATRYEDVRAVLRDKSFGQGDFVANIAMFYPPGFDVLANSSYRWLSRVFVMQDPPDHTRLRGLVVQALNARRVAAMRPRIQVTTDALLDRLIPAGRMDVIADFAYKLPTLVMCDMLGIDEHEYSDELLARLNHAIAESFLVFETRALNADELGRANAAMDFLDGYFGSLFERRRAVPKDDLTTALVMARDGDARLDPDELATVVIGLFGAGFETTAHMIGNGLHAFGRFPDEWRRLVADPALAASAVEEVLRFESSVQATYRTALADAEVGGVPVAKGQRVLTLLAAANRDPAVFDAPDRFDIARESAAKTLSFGGGIHYCVGAELARLEGEIAFATLARRLPGLRVDGDLPRWREGFLFRGLSSLPASW